ncbi:MAG: HEAT repeat domain-containing protein [Thermoanaerobaculia bacterium]
MAECSALRENMPLLLTESLDRNQRELTHQHIESCAACSAEWTSFQETWRLMADLPEVEVPARVKDRFLSQIAPAAPKSNVVPFQRRSATKWLTQAAAVALIAGGGYFAGHRTAPVELKPTPAAVNSVQPFSIAETRVLDSGKVSPTIEGRPDIQNVQFVNADPTNNKVGLSFDVTSRVTVNGNPNDPSMVRLLSYVLENEDSIAPNRSRTIDWVRQNYSGSTNPEIAIALAKVLRSDEHAGVRIRVADTLKTLPPSSTSGTRDALIEALKSDPNPAVRIKAVEALVNLARSGSAFEPSMVDALRQKASQSDENMYVRVKAAEVLSNIRPQ